MGIRVDRGLVGRLVIAACLMFVLALGGIALTRHSDRIASVWFANGAVLALMLRSPRNQWSAIVVAAFAANVGANFTSGDDLLKALGLSTCNAIEIMVAAAICRSLDIRRGLDPTAAIRLACAALVACAASAFGALVILSPPDVESARTLAIQWFVADALGLIIVGSLASAGNLAWLVPSDRKEWVEAAGFTALAASVCTMIFSGPAPLLFLLGPLCLFVGYRLRPGPSAIAAFLCSTIAISFTADGLGPIHAAPVSVDVKILLVQAFVAVTFLLTVPVSAMVRERDRLDKDLARSEREHRTLAESSTDIIARVGFDGIIRYASLASLRVLGRRPEDVEGKPADWTIHPDDVEATRDCFRRTCRGETGLIAQYRQQRQDGSWVWLEAGYNLVEDGNGQEIVATIRDIDDRCRAEIEASEASARLRESNRLLSLAERMAEVGHWRFDFATLRLDSSDLARGMVGLDPDSAIDARQAVALIHPDDRIAVRRLIAKALRGHDDGFCRARILVGADRHDHYFKVSIRAEYDDSGEMTGLFGIIRDIADKVANEQRLIHARNEAEAAAQAKSSFLATMSHEIRTPMTGVLGMIELLRGDVEGAERDQYLATLKQSADLLMTVLNDVLDYSKIEHGMLDLRPCDFDLEQLAQSTLDLFFNAASTKGLLISLAVEPGASAFVHGDPVRLQQVMSNLINNAVKFTERGHVQVRVKAVGEGTGHRTWRVEVRDSGIGISDADQVTLFDPFTQADNGDLRRFGGTGLGLAISRRLVSAMGGQIGVDSTPGKGSTFWFDVPLGDAETMPERRTRPLRIERASSGRRRLNVLVAEDNPVNQLLVSALLKRQGHVATCASNGLEAVEMAAARRYDCILMDMQMPEMDGIGATRAIRQSGGPCAVIPIIALTADASPERRRFYDQAGLTDFMTKPIDADDLERRLAALISDGDSAGEPALDPAHVERLRAALGPKRLQGLLDLFAVELERKPPLIHRLAATGDFAALAGEAHGLKGASLSIGATAVAEASRIIEDKALDGIGALSDDIALLDEAVALARDALAGALPQPLRKGA